MVLDAERNAELGIEDAASLPLPRAWQKLLTGDRLRRDLRIEIALPFGNPNGGSREVKKS
jgi:hypothetical protein